MEARLNFGREPVTAHYKTIQLKEPGQKPDLDHPQHTQKINGVEEKLVPLANGIFGREWDRDPDLQRTSAIQAFPARSGSATKQNEHVTVSLLGALERSRCCSGPAGLRATDRTVHPRATDDIS